MTKANQATVYYDGGMGDLISLLGGLGSDTDPFSAPTAVVNYGSTPEKKAKVTAAARRADELVDAHGDAVHDKVKANGGTDILDGDEATDAEMESFMEALFGSDYGLEE